MLPTCSKVQATCWHLRLKKQQDFLSKYSRAPPHPRTLTLQCSTTTCWESEVSHISMALHMAQILSSGGACRSGQPKSWTWQLEQGERLGGGGGAVRRFELKGVRQKPTFGFSLVISWRLSERFRSWNTADSSVSPPSYRTTHFSRAWQGRKTDRLPISGPSSVFRVASPETCPGVWTWAWPPPPSGSGGSAAPPAVEGRRRRWSSLWCRSGRSRSAAPSLGPSPGPHWSSWKETSSRRRMRTLGWKEGGEEEEEEDLGGTWTCRSKSGCCSELYEGAPWPWPFFFFFTHTLLKLLARWTERRSEQRASHSTVWYFGMSKGKKKKKKEKRNEWSDLYLGRVFLCLV